MQSYLERVQFLTKNYNFLQGWEIGLIGLLSLIEGLCIKLWGTVAAELITGRFFLPSLVLVGIGLVIARSYDRKKLGTVKISPLPRRTNIGLTLLGMLDLVVITISGPAFKYLSKIPLETGLLTCGILLNTTGLRPGRPGRHYVVFGVLSMGTAFLPAALLVSLEQFYYHGWTFILLGIAGVLCRAIDRLILVRNLASLQVQQSHV